MQTDLQNKKKQKKYQSKLQPLRNVIIIILFPTTHCRQAQLRQPHKDQEEESG
jgi:hypothetical protein